MRQRVRLRADFQLNGKYHEMVIDLWFGGIYAFFPLFTMEETAG
jgi:hypothetical protein